MREVREDPEELDGVGRGVPDGEGLATTLQGAKELSLEVNVKTRPPCGVFHMSARQKKTEGSQLGGWVGQKRLTWMLVVKATQWLWDKMTG